MTRLEDWLTEHAGRILGVVAIIVVLVSAATAWLIYDDAQQNEKLGGLEVVGPCRDFGPRHPECQRQSRLIHESMCLQGILSKSACHKAPVPFAVTREERSEPDAPSEGGGDSSGGSPPSGQPEPSPPGGGSPPASTPPPSGGNPPAPNPPPSQGPVGNIVDGVQGIVDQVQGQGCQLAPVTC